MQRANQQNPCSLVARALAARRSSAQCGTGAKATCNTARNAPACALVDISSRCRGQQTSVPAVLLLLPLAGRRVMTSHHRLTTARRRIRMLAGSSRSLGIGAPCPAHTVPDPTQLASLLPLSCASSQLHRFCDSSTMSACQRRNKLPESEHAVEYLVYAHFHDNIDDRGGYCTTAWTSVEMLDGLEDSEEASIKIQQYAARAALAAARAFNCDPDSTQTAPSQTSC